MAVRRSGRSAGRQGGRRVDLALGGLVLLAGLTGVAANTIGVNWPIDLIQVHAAAALAVLLLAPWKVVIARRGLRRPLRGRSVKALSLTFAGLVLLTVATGLIHSTGHLERLGPLTLMQIHVGAAVAALVALAGHFATHAVRPRRADADRRAVLRLAGLGAGAAAVTALWDTGPATARRFTGSVPRDRPLVTSWFNDGVRDVDPGPWRLRAGTAVLDLAAVLNLPHERFTAVLDCTSGWCSEQEWDGVRLSVLLATAGVPLDGRRSVEVRSVTGYARWFGVPALDRVWLVTGMGGRALPPGHGYPARIVAPGRRGFWWVKWVSEIRPSDRPAWAQSVFPLS